MRKPVRTPEELNALLTAEDAKAAKGAGIEKEPSASFASSAVIPRQIPSTASGSGPLDLESPVIARRRYPACPRWNAACAHR